MGYIITVYVPDPNPDTPIYSKNQRENTREAIKTNLESLLKCKVVVYTIKDETEA
ncbi:MAG: hypothetical protein WC365_08315 [Candidatus Babeliales bacterium]|jgi:hypothetical protein